MKNDTHLHCDSSEAEEVELEQTDHYLVVAVHGCVNKGDKSMLIVEN